MVAVPWTGIAGVLWPTGTESGAFQVSCNVIPWAGNGGSEHWYCNVTSPAFADPAPHTAAPTVAVTTSTIAVIR
jgi:hypothetical protein